MRRPNRLLRLRNPECEMRALARLHLAMPHSAILSAVIFNALIIIALISLALKGVKYEPMSAEALRRRT